MLHMHAMHTNPYLSTAENILALANAALSDDNAIAAHKKVLTTANAEADQFIATDELSNALRFTAFWAYAALNPDAFKAMLPGISAALVKNTKATPVDMAKAIVELKPAVYAVNTYLKSFLSEDALNANKVALEWSTDVEYTALANHIVKVTAFTGKNGKVEPSVAAANVIYHAGDSKEAITGASILRMELASKDTTGKYVNPIDVTEGIELTDELVAKKEMVARAILLAPGYVSDNAKYAADYSAGILTEADKDGNFGTIPKDMLTDTDSLYITDLEDLTKAYPYMVEFTIQFVTSADAGGSGSGGEATTGEVYNLKADAIDLKGSNGETLTVAAGTKYATSQDTAAKDA